MNENKRSRLQHLTVNALKGNKSAVELIYHLIDVSQTIDDIVDADKPLGREQLYRCFWQMLIEIPKNPFFHQNSVSLNAIMANALNAWFDANTLEAAGRIECLQVSFVLRDLLHEVFLHCILLVGGYEWLRQWSGQVRSFVFDELFDSYVAEHSAAEK